jgi:hypothetical protein
MVRRDSSRIARISNRLARPAPGRRWLPLFAIVEHHGRRTGRRYRTTVAARRVPDGFVIALAFGEQVDRCGTSWPRASASLLCGASITRRATPDD